METVSLQEYRKTFGRRNKYHAVKVPGCPYCGQTHDSKMEAARCAHLHVLAAQDDLYCEYVDVHPVVSLPGGIQWRLDFAIWHHNGEGVRFEDVKGLATADFKLKRKLFDKYHPAAPLRVVTGRQTKTGWTWGGL